MKREELAELLPDASDEQIEALFKKFGQEINPAKADAKAAKGQVAELTAQLESERAAKAALTASLEEARKKVEAGMTAEELLEQQKAQAAEREREFLLKSHAVDAKSLFVEAGCFEGEEIEALVEQVVGEDLDETLAKARSIIDVVQRHGKSVEEKVKDDLLKGNPKPQGGEGSLKPMSMKEFLALPYKEQLQLKADNPQIMSELTKE